MGIVYVLTNKINGKVYVGQTVQGFNKRHAQHKCRIDLLIGSAIRKYGKENFSHFENEVPEQFMDNLERNLIKLYDCISPNGYNLDSGGHDHKHACAETRKKQSEAKKGDRNPWFGEHLPEEHRKKIAEANSGERHYAFGKSPWNKGKRLTQNPCRMTLYNWKKKER